MILYHGTNKKGYDGILRHGYISVTNETNKRYETTKNGYIYVTSELNQAMDFSSRPSMSAKGYFIIVFEIEIDENQIQPDKDEEKWCSTFSNNGCRECYIINKNLFVGKEVKRVFYKEFSNKKVFDQYIQKVQNNEIIVNDDEWKKI